MAMTVKSGRWSDPTVWDSGVVPEAGAMAHVRAPHQIVYDRESDAILADVMSDMGSRLSWDTARETRLRVNTMMLSGISELVDQGLSTTPEKPRHEIVFHPIAGKEPGAGMGLGAVFMGPTRIHGYSKKGHLRSDAITIPAGASTITMPGLATSGWRQGDTIIILGSEYVLPATTDPQYTGPTSYYGISTHGSNAQRTLNEFQFGQDEERTIQSINLTTETVTLNTPLVYAHTGMTGTLKSGMVITVKPVIANVSRSIRFRTATAAEDPNADITVLQKRAHLMFMRQPDVDLRYFETKDMGRTAADPTLPVADLPYRVEMAGGMATIDKIRATNGGVLLENHENVRGRYAIHLHWCGGPYHGAPQVNLIGASAWASLANVPLPGWGVVQHGTRAAIEDCVVVNVRGAGIVSEIGNETGQWANNTVTAVRGNGEVNDWGSRSEVYTNHNGSVGIAYENQSRAILMHGNIAGSSKYGWLYHHQKDTRWKRGLRGVDLRLADPMFRQSSSGNELWQDEQIGAHGTQIPPFLDNEAWACRFGFSVIHRIGGESGPVKVPMLMERFHCVNTPFPWDVPAYSNTYYQKDCFFQGPLNMMDSSRAINLGSVSWDWNFSNCHLRNYRHAVFDGGAGLNYEGFLIDITTENVTNFTNAAYRTFAGASTHATKNVMGDWEDHAVNNYQAIIRRYKSINSASDLPQPYPLAPYGRKLPAGHPPVAFGGTPYFVLGDGTNGAASTDPVPINLTLSAGSGRNKGAVYGIIRDSVGDRRWPDWQTSETYPNNITVKNVARNFGKQTPEQAIQWHGCWNDAGTWKMRTWFPHADRGSLKRFWFHVDWTLTGFEPTFLAANDLGGPPPAPEWPDKLEVVSAPRSLTPITRTLRFLSRSRLENVAGQPLSHRLRVNHVTVKYEIAGGSGATQFALQGNMLTWASGTRTAGNSYSVIIRVTDDWGNTTEQAHEIIVVSSSRVSATITDNFDRANEDLTARADYAMLTGPGSTFAVRGNALAVISAGNAVADLGSLGTSEQEISVNFRNSSNSWVLMRMVDENNWIGARKGDSSIRVSMCVDGTITTLVEFPQAGQNTMGFRVQGRRLVLTVNPANQYEPVVSYPVGQTTMLTRIVDFDPLAEPGALLLPENAPMGTKVGLRAESTRDPWIDNLTATALPS